MKRGFATGSISGYQKTVFVKNARNVKKNQTKVEVESPDAPSPLTPSMLSMPLTNLRLYQDDN